MWISKKKIDDGNKELSELKKRIDALKKEIALLKQMLLHTKAEDVIVFCPQISIDDDGWISINEEICTYIYKDNKEYKINDLYVQENVDVRIDENDENILYITSRNVGKICDRYIIEDNYIVNLKDRSYLFLNSKSILKSKKKTE